MPKEQAYPFVPRARRNAYRRRWDGRSLPFAHGFDAFYLYANAPQQGNISPCPLPRDNPVPHTLRPLHWGYKCTPSCLRYFYANNCKECHVRYQAYLKAPQGISFQNPPSATLRSNEPPPYWFSHKPLRRP